MPTYSGHYYDVRPRRPQWSWSAYDVDRITPIGRGEVPTRAEAETTARECITRHLRGEAETPVSGA